jgi:hypothetical protein
MIGNVMQAAVQPLLGEISTRVVDALVSQARRPGRPYIADAAKADVWFSASDVHNLCPRLYAMAMDNHVGLREAVDAETLFNFAVGTAYHNAFQGEMLPAGLAGVFQGSWKREVNGVLETVAGATRGPYTERGWGPQPEGDYWEFWEPKGRIPEVRLVGKWDGVLAWPDAPHEVLELKSIRDEMFGGVIPQAGGKPLAAHILQVQAYMWMSGLSRARIVYVRKGAGSLRESMAEHVVERSEEVIGGLRASLEACLAAVNGARGVLPEKPSATCRIKSDPRARKCACKDVCFALAKAGA